MIQFIRRHSSCKLQARVGNSPGESEVGMPVVTRSETEGEGVVLSGQGVPRHTFFLWEHTLGGGKSK